MTQRYKSAHNRLDYLRTQILKKRRFASTLPAQGLCFLSSVSLLSSGFVFAQTETSVDNIVPTNDTSQPVVVTESAKKDTPVSSAQAQPDFVERRVRLRKKLTQENVSQSVKPVRIAKPQLDNSEPTFSVRHSQPKVVLLSELLNLKQKFLNRLSPSELPSLKLKDHRLKNLQKLLNQQIAVQQHGKTKITTTPILILQITTVMPLLTMKHPVL
jgi:hypothetical protein